MAQQASEKIGATLAPRGIASAVASAVGRTAGALISVVATGYGVISHSQEQPAMVEQLRVILNVALNEEWRELMENRKTGAMAGVYYLSGEIEDDLLGATRLQQEPDSGSLRIVIPAQ
ncbi:hypothetical protein D3C77_608780 [compost metagenome]